MNDVKQKIQEMMDEENKAKRKEELEELRGKKSKNKSSKEKKEKKEHIPMDAEKKKTIKHFGLIVVLILISLGLFYAASISKESAVNQYNQEIDNRAKQNIATILKQATQVLSLKINNFNHILKDAEYIKNFNESSWQDVLKTELEARIGEQAIVEIISANFIDDDIIDNPEMGYGVLSILNELKSNADNSMKIEVHKANSKDGRLVFIQKVTYMDAELKKDIVIGYIMARLPQVFMDVLIKDFKTQVGYIEIVQLFSGKASVLAKKGNTALKSMPLVISKKMANTQWTFKLWPAEQTVEPPASLLWMSILYLALGSLAIVSALVLLVFVLKNIQLKRYVKVPKRQVNKTQEIAATHDSSKVIRSEQVTDVIFKKDGGITLEEEDVPENEVLQLITDKIFRAYDIRGEVGEFINPEVFKQIAYGIAKEMTEQHQTKIAVACDGRNSSPELVKSVIDALLESGIDVLDIGMVSSPILYFAAVTKADGNGVIVTASHNPANYNGMKIMLSGHSYSEVRLQKLKAKVIRGEQVSGDGKLLQMNVMEDYITKITGNIILARPMNIVIDSGNGVTGKFATTFFEQLGCKVTALNSDVDGNFPVHDPDPSRPENLSELIEKVAEMKADLGIAFDGDGDRIGLISSGGEIIWPDRILMLLAKDILSRNKEATILYDVKSSWKLERYINDLGGKAIMCKSGHSFMKSKLLETGALLAGEMSGHIFIKERWFGFDDALFVAARVLEILSIDLRKSRQVFAELPDSLNTPEILIATNTSAEIMEKISADTSCFDDGEIITIDGIRVNYSDGWGLVRASNTTENLTLRFEADNEEALQRIANVFKESILSAEPTLEFPF
ncbi:MAG: phosphomannomutase/phosphoglucomutase [Gammaproteobacteria bacterium]|nr:phosphomannomutase/phosphoglucomutase [Gammaproteobacteria bacterium]